MFFIFVGYRQFLSLIVVETVFVVLLIRLKLFLLSEVNRRRLLVFVFDGDEEVLSNEYGQHFLF